MASGDIYDMAGEIFKVEDAMNEILKKWGHLPPHIFSSIIAMTLDEYFLNNDIPVELGWAIINKVSNEVHTDFDFLYHNTDSAK